MKEKAIQSSKPAQRAGELVNTGVLSKNVSVTPSQTLRGVRERLESEAAEVFNDILADTLEAGPNKQQIQAFAAENPLNWARMVQVFAGLAGHANSMKQELDINVRLADIHEMDYEELIHLVSDMHREINNGLVIDAEEEKMPNVRDDSDDTV